MSNLGSDSLFEHRMWSSDMILASSFDRIDFSRLTFDLGEHVLLKISFECMA